MEYEIEQFFIANDYQNRGYGGWFLENIIQQLQSCKNKHNINAVILNTHIAYPAFSFYKKVGFDIVDDYRILARYI